ncbi:MAG: glycosyltransferase family 2 protein [Nitrosospira sp.]
MKFSIITCTWNSAAYLRQSIESVGYQTYQDIEYIFIDGGSEDGTLEIIDGVSIEKKVMRGIRGGVSPAMNRGIEMATGDIIVHLHSDDYFAHERVLEHVHKAFENSSASWLFGRCLSDINGTRVPETYVIPKYNYQRLLKGNFIPHPATFIRRGLFEQLGTFDTRLKYAMDYDQWLRLGSVTEPLQLDEHLSVFRRHAGSLSTSNRIAVLEEDYQVRLKYTSSAPWWHFYHYAHFLVRRSRIQRQLRMESGG